MTVCCHVTYNLYDIKSYVRTASVQETLWPLQPLHCVLGLRVRLFGCCLPLSYVTKQPMSIIFWGPDLTRLQRTHGTTVLINQLIRSWGSGACLQSGVRLNVLATAWKPL
jgi:hypothetical protein